MLKRFNITIINNKPTCPELAGYELPSLSRGQEDDVEAMAEHSSEVQEGTYTPQHKVTYKHGFIDGYAKARDRFEFTESDLKQAIDLGLKLIDGNRHNLTHIDNFIQSLRTPRTPIAIEVEMERVWNGDCFDIPATNPDGTVKGTYIFNE